MKKKEYLLLTYNLFISALTLCIIFLLDLQEAYYLMLVYSLNSALVFGLLIYEEIRHFKGLNINLLFLAGCLLRLVLPAITKSIGAINGEKFFFLIAANEINDFIFPTVVWMNIYYSLFFYFFVRLSSKYYIDLAIKPFYLKYNTYKITIPLFIVGIIYNILVSFIPAGILPSFLQSLLGQFTKIAIIGQLFEALFKPTRFNKILFTLFILISLWQTMFFGFYKGPIMMNFLYFFLYYFLDKKYHNKKIVSPSFVVGIISIFLLIDFVIYPFMTTKRIESGWDVTMGGIATQEYSNISILSDILSGKSKDDTGDVTATERMDAISPNAFFYKECCKKGLRTTKLVKNNVELLVPRFIKPDKHSSQAGLMVYAYATTGTFDNYDIATSNNYIGQFASSYLIGGGIMVFILALFNGWFSIFYYNFLMKRINYYIAIILLIPHVLDAIMAFEEIHDGGALRTGYNSVMMLVLFLMTKFFPNFLNANKMKR